jgi:hypothetical protein
MEYINLQTGELIECPTWLHAFIYFRNYNGGKLAMRDVVSHGKYRRMLKKHSRATEK